MNSPIVMDALESRRLLSASQILWLPMLPANSGPLASAAYAVAQSDVTKLRGEQSTLASDCAALSAAISAAKTTLAGQLTALQNTAMADQQANTVLLKADVKAFGDIFKADAVLISTDLKNIGADEKAHNTAQLATDRAQLATDKAKLTADLTGTQSKLKADLAAARATAEADGKAIHDLFYGDAAVAAANTKLTADQAMYQTDFNTFVADRTTLLTDLKNRV